VKAIPVIDLFAGPGGLSHGFSSYRSDDVSFEVRLSIEKDEIAYRTLLLRAFVRQFKRAPAEYYQYIRSEGPSRESLAEMFPKEWAAAESEAKQWTLGEEPFINVSRAILSALDGAPEWLLIGGPPCQAYSLAGRSRMRNFSDFSKDERHTLYREYLRIVAVHQPPFFVMENVKGILSSKHGARGTGSSIFEQILSDLRDPGSAVSTDPELADLLPKAHHRYTIHSFSERALFPEALHPNQFIIRSEDWGVPQRRHRVILFGIRDDVTSVPPTLPDLFHKEPRISIDQVIDGLPTLRSGLSKADDSQTRWAAAIKRTASRKTLAGFGIAPVRKELAALAKRLPKRRTTGLPYSPGDYRPIKLSRWLWDKDLRGVIQHQSRAHMAPDLMRYFFSACFALIEKRAPTLADFPKALLPAHANLTLNGPETAEGDTDQHFGDRFRVQVRGEPATTITSHISKDGHYYIHYDPLQCRSLTVREAARLQTFPDSYFFEGNRTQQYHQVGNAVPPLLALKLANVVAVTARRQNIHAPQQRVNPAAEKSAAARP
jgi:DNA (cytosine-5)-methyltransferase 1